MNCSVSASLLVVALVWIMGGGTICVRANSQNSSDEEVVRQLERDSLDATVRHDVEAYGRVLADDFIGHWANDSTTTRQEEIEMLRTGKECYEENRIIDMKVRIYGTTAIVSGQSTETSVIEGKSATGVYNFTDVFLKRNGRWQIVATQTARPIPYGVKRSS
jgi:ketosteroid isomerase-like protein